MSSFQDRIGKYGWILIFLVSIVFIINGLFYLLTGAESDTQLFQHMTGIPWSNFVALGQGTSKYVEGDLRILGVVLAIAGSEGCAIAYTAFRKGERWALGILGLAPLGLLYTAVYLYVNDGSTWPLYLILLIIYVVGLLLPYRKFFPKK